MKFKASGLLATFGFAAVLGAATPATADFWWETDQGTLYWHDASGDWGVFRFLNKETNQIQKDIAIYIDGLGPQYTGIGIKPGTYDAQWFNYVSSDCDRQAVDPDGNVSSEWGVMSFTVHEDYNYFTAEVYNCDDDSPVATFKGTPGT